MENKTILVTGGAGYIGSHACKVLHQNGFMPVVYDNLSEGNEDAVKWGDLVKGNILDKDKLDTAFKKYKPVAVMHFAASAIVSESMKKPQKYYLNNVEGSLTLFDVMLENNVKHLIFSSSCATYGIPKEIPINEEHPQKPISPYGKSKLMVEEILKDYDRAYNLSSISLRYFNAAGADIEIEIGEDTKTVTRLIPLAIHTILNEKEKLDIYGLDFKTEDGSAIRDYIHVMDIADAHLKALQHLLKTKKSDFFNLGTGKGYSVLEIIKTIEEISKNKVNVNYTKKREGDPAVLIAEAKKAQKVLGWSLKNSDLETIIITAYKWHKKRNKEKI